MAEHKILPDEPSTNPALGFGPAAQALAEIISNSDPCFAVGVFGGWGSGKTTLMQTIQRQLSSSDSVVSAVFNAWRYQREPSLLVPLIDTVRGALAKWSAERDPRTRRRTKRATERIAHVVRGLATGLTGEIGVPGAAKIGYDFSKAMDALAIDRDPDRPQSLYAAAFEELSEAIAEFRRGGVDRIVVFVDDLDRCLPGNALAVLESMKLFFDFPGVIFVAGLDEGVIQRALQTHFFGFAEAAPISADNESISGASRQAPEQRYIDKIFQVPYRLPPASKDDLAELLESMYRQADLPPEQLADFKKHAEPHLNYLAVNRQVNPREVKRFLNTYSLQTRIRRDLDPDIVLALQVMAARSEWRLFYLAILTSPSDFIDALKAYKAAQDSAFEAVAPELNDIPADLRDYLRSNLIEPLAQCKSLEPYLSSLRSTGVAAQTIINADRSNYAENVITTLRAGLPSDWVIVREPQTPSYRFDGMVTGPSHKQIVVEAFFNPRFTGYEFSRAIKSARQSQQLRVDAVLVVAASRNASGFRRLKEEFSRQDLPNEILEWDPGKPSMTLIKALNDLIAKLQT
jgi:hypothetical protein